MSKKYFGTDGIRGKVGESLINPTFVMKLGWAIGNIMAADANNKVIIGKDTRISGYMLESALEAGLSAAGMDIRLLGPMPTPAVAYLTRTFRARAGIVISASHNPYHDNGLKFFSSQGLKLADELEFAIEEQLEKPMTTVDSSKLGKAFRINDAPGRYVEFCKSTVPSQLDLRGLKIVVDCANGANYYVAPAVFKELGANVVKVSCEPDGFNINDCCGSTYTEKLQRAVKDELADVGIAFDGDGDRVLMVDHKGEVVDGDELLYVIARYLLQRERLGGGVVGTAMSNLGFELSLQALGVAFERTAVGDRYVMAELQKRGWHLGGEPSGHLVNLGLTTTGDGIISALQVLSAMVDEGQDLHALKQGMQKFPQVLVNVTVEQEVDLEAQKIQHAIRAAQASLGERGRVLVRKSGTEPKVRVMVEGERQEQVEKMAHELAAVVKSRS